MEARQASHKPHEQEAVPHKCEGGGTVHQCWSPCRQNALVNQLIVSHKELGQATPNHVEAEDSRGEDKQEESSIVALKMEKQILFRRLVDGEIFLWFIRPCLQAFSNTFLKHQGQLTFPIVVPTLHEEWWNKIS